MSERRGGEILGMDWFYGFFFIQRKYDSMKSFGVGWPYLDNVFLCNDNTFGQALAKPETAKFSRSSCSVASLFSDV